MNSIKYPQGKYDRFFLIVLFFCAIISIALMYFKTYDIKLIFIALFLYHIVNGIHKTKTLLLSINNGTIKLDRGMFHKKLSLEISTIKCVEGLELNHEILKITFHLQNGSQIDYIPPTSQRQISEYCVKILCEINPVIKS